MSVIRTKTSDLSAASEDEIVADLVRELDSEPAADSPLRQPIIFEQLSPSLRPQIDTLHVAVVWERWRLVSAARRAQLILKAYEQAAPDRFDRITIAMGVTAEEAVDLGLLPYGIEPVVRDSNGVSPKQVEQLMRSEGAVATPVGLLLRFPTVEAAEAAHERLTGKTNPHCWAIVRTVRTDD